VEQPADRYDFLFAWRRRLTGLQGLAPRHELDGRDGGEHTDHEKHRELGHEGVARKIIGRALLEIEHPQKPDDKQRAGGNAVYGVGGEQLSRSRCRQLLAD
jgi:hypothetical protein